MTSDVFASEQPIVVEAVRRTRRMLGVARRIVRNAVIDVRFGRPLGGVFLQDRSQSNSDYADLERLFRGRIDPDEVCVDVGCGAGRVINHWLRMGVRGRIYGLECDPVLAAATRRRLRRRGNVTIVEGDAVSNLPFDGTLFFLFNPFGESTTRRFADAILELATRADRDLAVVYLNCKHVSVFTENPRFRVGIERLGRGTSGQSVATIVALRR